MDTSETYIKMCEKAEEIQKLRKDWVVGDIYFIHYCPTGWIAYASIGCSGEDCGSLQDMSEDRLIRLDGETWLPRQDQLQEMAEVKSSGRLIYEFHYWYINHLVGVPIDENEKYFFQMSMEQLWLAFVMKEKCNKIWNGTDWK